MKRKTILSLAFIVSLLPMLLNQYGGCRGVQEISGLMNLLNPIGIGSVTLYVVGVWFPFQKKSRNTLLSILGLLGIILSEIYIFLTWHTLTITGEVSLQSSIRFAFPEFYIGLAVSVGMLAAYFMINKGFRDESC